MQIRREKKNQDTSFRSVVGKSKLQLYLAGHYAVVAADAVGGLAEAAAGLNESPHFGDAHRLYEGLPHRLLRRNEDGVHGVIRHPFPHILVIENQRNLHLLQVLPGANPA